MVEPTNLESFELLKAIYKIPNDLYKENMEYFADLLELGELYRTPLRQLSLGQRMRAELAASLATWSRTCFARWTNDRPWCRSKR